jgi:hypothetical protein
LARADLVAYKGGVIERDLLKFLGTKGINLEILGCDKYNNLITKYGILPVRCRYQQLGNLSEHARVKIAWARENCVALAGNLKIIINKDGGKLF